MKAILIDGPNDLETYEASDTYMIYTVVPQSFLFLATYEPKMTIPTLPRFERHVYKKIAQQNDVALFLFERTEA